MSFSGVISHDQGDQAAAREYYQRALDIRKRQALGSLDMASSLNNLASLASDYADWTSASHFYQEALKIYEHRAPGSQGVPYILNNLGEVARQQGHLRMARAYEERALAIRMRLAPDSLNTAESLNNLGLIAHDLRELRVARTYYESALAIQKRLAPGSLAEAISLNNLGELFHNHGNGPEKYLQAERLVGRAWEIVKMQAGFIAGDDARQAFGGLTAPFASNLVGIREALHNPEGAFATLEEGRAQSLLQLLSERNLIGRLAPPNLSRQYRIAVSKQNQAQKALEHADDSEARTRYTLARLDAERVRSRIRQSLRTLLPVPANLEETRRALPPDAVFTAFSLGERRSLLFLVRRRGAITVCRLSLTEKELLGEVRALRQWVTLPFRGPRGVVRESVRRRHTPEALRSMYARLFPREAQQILTRARRLILSPDGVLWNLPFAALVTNPGEATPRYLGLEKPLIYAQSLATYAQVAKLRGRRTGKVTAVVIGNPNPPSEEEPVSPMSVRASPTRLVGSRLTPRHSPIESSIGLRLPVGRASDIGERGTLRGAIGRWPSLPYAHVEARIVAREWGVRAAIGSTPTERWFRKQAGRARIIHLATHGFLNPVRVMSSGVLLARPATRKEAGETRSDGVLQAWEWMSEPELSLQAELVVLSACETGRGATVQAEGLVGLTRALHVAGARSIVASQWQVADSSTASLMEAFHRELRHGVAKDEALRRAMVASWQRWPHPYHWAAFLLVHAGGDKARVLARGKGAVIIRNPAKGALP